ncbi:MAG: YihY/virulence factor BrkB family protein [Methylobacter sp.]|nr:YihY/virulence factor BrkB family protein [Methylobacter sp.]MDP2428615.1 YihY/virulence factor BrkB family protein [Methylobacter sp.]MDP3056451.1 YihY/virulence factor BrkB family protein [Methylobacter sp.]MDP3363197.1 YihY/virulence factor BrkB family protein [Methylobacter sp.]MDZ4217906.1 YihY/virulence factor BrkB family protein [Methylobacter sp.]
MVNILNFFKDTIWQLPENELPAPKAALLKTLKTVLLAIQGFTRDLCQLRASALTLYTLLAVVPIIAMLFGIAKGFGLEKMLEQQLLEQIPHQDATVITLIGFAQKLLANTEGGVVAGIGVVVLLWTVINMISNIEESFNYIWKVSKGRTLSRKLSDYLSFMLLAPVLLILAGSITVFVKTQLMSLGTVIALPKFGERVLLGALSYSPLLLMIGLFSITFIFIPNHKVNYKAGIVAGVVTGILYHFIQWLYLSLQIGVSSHSAIYGSLAALPLFVIWVQIGWMIVLFGCEMAFYLQNYDSCRHNNQFPALSFALKKIIALQITRLIVLNTVSAGRPLTAENIGVNLQASKTIIQPLLDFLVASHVLLGLTTDEDEHVYLPAVDINRLGVAFVLNALERCGENKLPDLKQDTVFTDLINNAEKWLESSGQDRLLKDC